MSDSKAFERNKKLQENVLGAFKDSTEKRYEAWKKEDPDAFENIVLENLPKQCSLTEMKRYIAEMKTLYREKLSRILPEEASEEESEQKPQEEYSQEILV